MAGADYADMVTIGVVVKPQGRKGEVLVKLERSGDRGVVLSVGDSGPGVPETLRERIFEPLFTTKQESGNVGLGLTAARAIAAQHGGTLMLSTQPSGATFILDLPGEAPGGG